jgi:hypothetical protein
MGRKEGLRWKRERGEKKKNVNFIIFWHLFFLFSFASQFDRVFFFFFLIWRNFSIYRRRNCDFFFPSVNSTKFFAHFIWVKFSQNFDIILLKIIICTVLTSERKGLHIFTRKGNLHRGIRGKGGTSRVVRKR